MACRKRITPCTAPAWRAASGEWRDKARPVLINNWEATYFNFTEDKILSLAHTAQQLGIEMIVLDDGWFGQRNDDTTSLGDWVVDTKKLPHGLKYLGEEIHTLGLRFGLWFEPEMINKDSDLYRAHPDWLIHVPQRSLSHGRNQFILDYSRPEVRDAVFAMLVNILENAPIDYVKWDMNRNMTEIGSAGLPKERQKETAHRYILGLYDLLERITQRFPHVLFESCASGGGRFDPGMLAYMPQTWTSDDSDAIERLKIQYGTSLVYPLSAMGAHVSAAPNHQIGRNTPLATRADVAFFGVFGYELDIERLPQADLDAIKQQVAFYKAHRALLHQGTFYRLTSPFERNYVCWMVVAPDQREALLGYYKVLARPNASFLTVRLQGLAPDVQYEIQAINNPLLANPMFLEYLKKMGMAAPALLSMGGDELMYRGFQLPIDPPNEGDFSSYLWKLQAC